MTRNISTYALLWAALLFGVSPLLLAQENLIEKLSEQEAENNAEAETPWHELLAQPLEVNRLTREELVQFPFLTHAQINAFLQDRQKPGGFKNLDEALAALAVSGDTLAFCREIFYLTPPKNFAPRQLALRWRLSRPAAVEKNWLGASYRSYERARFSAGAFAFGLLAERDPGESRFADHQIFYGQWQYGTLNKGWRVLAGNYQIEWAQGLALWGPYGTPISSEAHTASRRAGRGLLPYFYGDENAALRGGAWSANWNHFSCLIFASAQNLDATLRDSATASHFYESGYHRTVTELSRRKTVQEQLLGLALKFRWRRHVQFGMLAYRSEYDKNWIQPNLAAGYFNFTGRRHEVLSLFVASTWTGAQMHLEVAQSRPGGTAGSLVLSGEAAPLRWTAESHYYARDFYSPHGRGFNTITETPQNEFGYALALSSALRRGVSAEIFMAQQQDLWRTSTLPLPGSRLTTGARMEWQIRRDLVLFGRWQHTRDEALASAQNVTAPSNSSQMLQEVAPASRQSGRLKLAYQVSAQVNLSSRFDFVRQPHWRHAAIKKSGLALSQEIRYALPQRFFLIARYTFFDTPTALPIYQYEHDLPGVFTNFALRERGRRAYIYLRCLPFSGLAASLKLAGAESERSIFDRVRSGAWGVQLDWQLSNARP